MRKATALGYSAVAAIIVVTQAGARDIVYHSAAHSVCVSVSAIGSDGTATDDSSVSNRSVGFFHEDVTAEVVAPGADASIWTYATLASSFEPESLELNGLCVGFALPCTGGCIALDSVASASVNVQFEVGSAFHYCAVGVVAAEYPALAKNGTIATFSFGSTQGELLSSSTHPTGYSFINACGVQPAGTYSISLIAHGELSAESIEATVSTSFYIQFQVTPCPGDLNADGITDQQDLAYLLRAWETESASADLDQSGLVDAPDLAILLGEWGACGT